MKDKNQTSNFQPIPRPVLTFADTENGVRAFCHKCGEFSLDLDIDETNKKPIVKCLHCGFQENANLFKIQHRDAMHTPVEAYPLQSLTPQPQPLRHETAVSDPLEKKYPFQKLNGNPSELDFDESEPSAIEKIAPEKVFKFDDGLIQQGTAFEELFRYYSRHEIPPQFAFVGTIATIAAKGIL
jgi:hypothetical protein